MNKIVLIVVSVIGTILISYAFYMDFVEARQYKTDQVSSIRTISQLRLSEATLKATIEAYREVFSCTETGKLLGVIKKRQKMCKGCRK